MIIDLKDFYFLSDILDFHVIPDWQAHILGAKSAP